MISRTIRATLIRAVLGTVILWMPHSEAMPQVQSSEAFCPPCNCPDRLCPPLECPAPPIPRECPSAPPPVHNCATDPALKQYVQASIPQCLSCSQTVLDFAATCGSNACNKWCDPSKGEYLWEPTCECLKKEVLCDKLTDAKTAGGEGIAFVNTILHHPETHGDYQYQTATFQHVTISGSVNDFGTAQDLANNSACLSKIRNTCVGLGIEGVSWTSALTSARYGDKADECMYEVLNSASGLFDASKMCAGTKFQAIGYKMDSTAAPVTVDLTKYTASGYLNTDCTAAEKWKVDLITQLNCPVRQYNFNYVTTPISLLWGDGVDIALISARSKFPLNPELSGKWFEWKASGYTPLVVWDPEGTGVITEAHQLFGNFTWKKSWKHGYEALASLDKNSDGWLEGAELQSIALWFDFNQDGVSDKDEVKKLASVGVEAIGVKPNEAGTLGVKADSSSQGRRNIFADKGFKRSKNGKVTVGRSVDWFVGHSDARLDAEALNPSAVVPLPGDILAERAQIQSASKDFTGFWDWKVVSEDDFPQNLPGGMLRIRQKGGTIEGYSMIQDKIAPNGVGLGYKITSKGFKGDTRSENGGQYMRFETVGTGDSPVYAIANLSSDGQTIKGLSKEKLPNGKWVEYSWIARRYR
jgi:hypothetical protein